MSAIRRFFEKKNIDKKFKKAGEGRSLNDSGSSSQPQRNPKKNDPKPQQRIAPSEGAQRAAAAALARQEADRVKNRPPNWSLSAIRAQAKKELEEENQKELSNVGVSSASKELVHEGAPVLTVNGVFFTCPLIGPEVLSKLEMQIKIKEFLYEQMEEEKALTSCLLIHTCNKDKEKVKVAVDTLCKYLKNIIENPSEEKFRKIRLQNKVFKEKVSNIEGTLDFLIGAGFVEQKLQAPDGNLEDYMIYPQEKLEDLEYLRTLVDALPSAEPILPTLDRNIRVLMPSQALARVTLPNEFFNLTLDEIKREQERKSAEVELNSLLRTKAMKEREANREMRKYRYSLMRIRFSDGIILQGTFSAKESLRSVYDFVSENLSNLNQPFQLLSPGSEKLVDMESTLCELQLVPAALLTFVWTEAQTSPYEEDILRPEILALVE